MHRSLFGMSYTQPIKSIKWRWDCKPTYYVVLKKGKSEILVQRHDQRIVSCNFVQGTWDAASDRTDSMNVNPEFPCETCLS